MSAEASPERIGNGRGGSIVWGILMLVCGILAIALPWASSIGVAIVIGWVILFSAVWHLIYAFHARGAGGVFWQLLLVIVYGAAGILILFNPVAGALTITFVLAVFLFIEAGIEAALYYTIRKRGGAGWILFDAIVTLLLAILIWTQWPNSSLWVLGTLVGISLIFSGISRITLSSAMARKS